jgi:aldose 1-epimerase
MEGTSKTAMADGAAVSLTAGDLRAVFWPGFGMLGASLQYCGEELLRRIDDLETAKQKGNTAGIPLLYPWANRLGALHYRAAGRDVDLDPHSPFLHFDGHGLAMHGVPWGQIAWQVLETKQHSLRARLDWKLTDLLAVFPYPHSVEISIKISPTSLQLQTEVSADSESPVPISFGFHPYFGIPHVARAQWRLQLPAMKKLQLDARGIPAGASEAYGPFDGPLRQESFDDGFALLDEGEVFSLSGGEWKINISFLEGFRYAQVFGPADKEFVALEPMTAPANALISREDLRILEPGGRFRASFRIDVHSQKKRGE